MSSREQASTFADDPLWFKDSVIYQLHVRSFFDSDGDGIGDFAGLTSKLDYLKDLGVGVIWLLPFYPSPLKDDGYDIADYTSVNPAFGTLNDIKVLVREAHRRGLRVVSELVCNHTSDQHPWFQRARRAKPGSVWRDFYVWSDTPEKYKDARIIFKDFEASNWTWDPVASAYYWHRFYSHQPDLNYDSPQVRQAILRVMDFWLRLGIDGLRLDAIPYLYQREGTNCENLPETHTFLRELRRHVDDRFTNRMLIAEANQWPEDAVAYFGKGDECHMAFHFPLMPRMFMALHMEDRFPVADVLMQTPMIPETAQWAVFLRNHDELTLEMVTDEERDYMLRAYARDPEARINLGIRRRLSPLLGNHRRRIELMNGLLFSLPGTPVIYYGDEIGMGDNIFLGDRNSVRTPMQWSADRNAGFSHANSQRLYSPVVVDPEFNYETVNVETQQSNPYSLLWWMKRLIAIRKRFKAFGRGSLQLLQPDNRKILAFVRRFGQETILVVANLSRFVQGVYLDLSDFRGMVPVEVFGRTDFPPVGDQPYFLTLGPHAFYWFALESRLVTPLNQGGDIYPQSKAAIPVLSGNGDIGAQGIAAMLNKAEVGVMSSYLNKCLWYSSKTRHIKSIMVGDSIVVPNSQALGYVFMTTVEYTDSDAETYAIPLVVARGDRAIQLIQESPQEIVARLQLNCDGEERVLYNALVDPGFSKALLATIAGRHRLRGTEGEVHTSTSRALRQLLDAGDLRLGPALLKGERRNSSVIYGDRFILKLFRRLEVGTNPDLEIGRYLTKKGFVYTPKLVGAIEYRAPRGDTTTLALLHEYVPEAIDAWQLTLDVLGHFFERVLALRPELQALLLCSETPLSAAEKDTPPVVHEMIGAYFESAWLLGKRTAEMHLALAADADDPVFAPEPFSTLYQRSIFQSMRVLTTRVCKTLQVSLSSLPERVQLDAHKVLDRQENILERFQRVADHKILASRIRCHGDYHLGQVLYTGREFIVTNFEGELARPLSERRIKRSPLRDVAGMLRSFDYAAQVALTGTVPGVSVRPEDLTFLEPWARYWSLWVSATFLKAYLASADQAPILPMARKDIGVLLDAFLLEKAIYELGYELNNRPMWAHVPLQGILQFI
ncbi:MAG: maltose alpha-D-glucosyltransferase, partial [Dehalococcoidia bacterium]|nr:maltose alpha-D-glucosyltransferase [Dehalococcoidia bacterium]